MNDGLRLPYRLLQDMYASLGFMLSMTACRQWNLPLTSWILPSVFLSPFVKAYQKSITPLPPNLTPSFAVMQKMLIEVDRTASARQTTMFDVVEDATFP